MTTRRLLTVIAATLVLGSLGAAPAAHAAPPPRWGFGFVDWPTVPLWTPLAPAHQATSLGTTVDGGTLGPGRFRVRFPGVGTARIGNVHVTAVDTSGHYCVTVGWGAAGPDELVDVQCFARGGVPDDSRFMVMWTANAALPPLPGWYASAQFNAASGTVVQSYNSTGAPVTITPLGTGATVVRFGAVGNGRLSGNAQVTALSPAGAPRWCKIAGWDTGGADLIAQVRCFDATGRPVDSDFTVSYHRQRSVVSAYAPPKNLGYAWTPNPSNETNFNAVAGGFGLNTVSPNGTGHVIVFPALAIDETHAQVTAFGATPNYCTLGKTPRTSGADLIVYARCYDPTGLPLQDDTLVTATNRT